jgi:serine-type D-Ala-D-Ala carboxypeptidase/endopeptidase (penicillin-binding protein 4)
LFRRSGVQVFGCSGVRAGGWADRTVCPGLWKFRFSLALLLLSLGHPGWADLAALQAGIDTATESVRRHAFVGVLVRSLTRGDTLYQRDAERVFVPASNQKLLTSATALERLGPDYRFVTRVLATGEMSADGTLHGDLVLQGGGDPILSTADLADLARQVAGSGIRRVQGALRADESRFDANPRGRGWSAGDEFDYSNQISALSLNRNRVTVRVAPEARPGRPAAVTLEPATTYLRITSRCITGPAGATGSVSISRARDRNEVTIRGVVPAGHAPVVDTVTVEQPALYTASVFRDALEDAGMVFTGPTLWLRAPFGARSVVEHSSPPLAEILPLLNKPSDNFIAEMLLQAIGAERRGYGTTAAGAAEVRAFLSETVMDATPVVVSDGSGLSRMDLVSPTTICGLLEFMSRHRDAEVFRRSLPIAGVDGTLGRRMRNTSAANNAHAKTGTLTHVTALSGYVTAANGETLVFSVMTNNYPGAPTPKAMEDEVCQALSEFSR